MIDIKVPSKTFIVGEYVALAEGPALIANTAPEFIFHISKKNEGNESVKFFKNSPCDKLYKANKELFSPYNLKFMDPHIGKGGFGASGAKFNALLSLKNIIEKKPLFNSLDSRDRLLHYSNTIQSGYDIISQFNGKICYINIKDKKIDQFNWPFKDVYLTIARTGIKIKTHEHLKKVKVTGFEELSSVSQQTIEHFRNENLDLFCEGIDLFYNKLIESNFICEASRFIVSKIKRETPWCMAVKACGAAGADTILLIHSKKYKDKVRKYLKDNQLELIFSGNQFCDGMAIDTDSDKLAEVGL